MLSSALSRSMRCRSFSRSAPVVTRILPSKVRVFSCSSIALESSSSLIRPWLTRKCPRYSSGLDEDEDRMRLSLKKIGLSTLPLLISRVPLFLLCDSHCSSSSSCMVRKLPTMPMICRRPARRSDEADGRRDLIAMDRVDEADDLARQRHEERRRAAAAADEPHPLEELAVGHAGGAEQDLLAGGQVLGRVDAVVVLHAERPPTRPLRLL